MNSNANAIPGPSNPRSTYYTPSHSAPYPYGGADAPSISYPNHVPSGYFPSHASASPKQEDRESNKVTPPSREPQPACAPHWDSTIRTFLAAIGMSEALKGFDRDILAMNSQWEHEIVSPALARLISSIQAIDIDAQDRPLDNRKLDYMSLAVMTAAPTTVCKSISKFLAQNRARNDASNRAEFLLSLEQRAQSSDTMDAENESTCARTDARHIDRNAQIKYDVAKNDDHLRRTTKWHCPSSTLAACSAGIEKAGVSSHAEYTEFDERVSAERHPGLDARLKNVESHFAVNYVPAPPLSLLARIKLLEDHIIKLEKEYPPWAALHFNQPSRDWPPPPPPTPVIVPSHLPKTTKYYGLRPPNSSLGNGGKSMSSLQRAVMERLEVQKAMKSQDTEIVQGYTGYSQLQNTI